MARGSTASERIGLGRSHQERVSQAPATIATRVAAVASSHGQERRRLGTGRETAADEGKIGVYGTVWVLVLAYSYRIATATRLTPVDAQRNRAHRP